MTGWAAWVRGRLLGGQVGGRMGGRVGRAGYNQAFSSTLETSGVHPSAARAQVLPPYTVPLSAGPNTGGHDSSPAIVSGCLHALAPLLHPRLTGYPVCPECPGLGCSPIYASIQGVPVCRRSSPMPRASCKSPTRRPTTCLVSII